MSLNLNQQESINNALTQISSTCLSDLSNSSINSQSQSQSDINEEITMEFKFLTGQIEKVKGKPDEKFYDVFKRFNETQCPEGLKNFVCRAIHNSNAIDNKKTLLENNIKNGDIICFFFEDENLSKYKKKENDDENNDEEKEEEDSEINDSSEDEENGEDEEEKKLVYESWIEEYKCELVKKYILKMLKSETNENLKINLDSKDFLNFLNGKYKELGKKIKEHEHKVIYLVTDFDWKCKECKKNYSKNEPRLYCSICDFNMCNTCRKEKKYYHLINIPNNVEPSNKKVKKQFIKYKGHKHRLSYCRTKRTICHGGWLCDECKDEFSNKIWTFYCTCCDYDLCTNCAKKAKLI